MTLSNDQLFFIIPLLIGFFADFIFGDPRSIPHLIVGFGNSIFFFEKRYNKGTNRRLKGAFITILLTSVVFLVGFYLLWYFSMQWVYAYYIVATILFFYCISHRSLLQEGNEVLKQLECDGLEAGRKRLSWIVGRDTSQLTPQQIRIAVFETVSENLSDGVIGPLFWYTIGGVPAMLAYKMINTLDSMIGYKSERYKEFGSFAARLDDVVNFIPARITAVLIATVNFSYRSFRFIFQYGNNHASPNSGYPEAALAGVLNCRFGGPNVYHGQLFDKPYIGECDREISSTEYRKVIKTNHKVVFLMVILMTLIAML